MQPANSYKLPNTLLRAKLWYAVLLVVAMIFVVRLFYLQVIKYDHYKNEALYGEFGQFKEYQIPAQRGTIAAYNGDSIVPLVLNEAKYTVFADPTLVPNPTEAAGKLETVLGGSTKDYEDKMRVASRYVVIQKKLSQKQKEAIDALELKGVGTREELYRTYPQGSLAAQVLGFVNDEGVGTYGVEQYLDSDMKGTPGQLKAITDASGIPLVSNQDNIVTEPQPGKRVVLTIDVAMQKQVEDILRRGLARAQSKSGSLLVLEAQTGAVKAMANFPTYKPNEFFNVKDPSVFSNAAVSAPLEVGSIMKPLTTAAALDQGVISSTSTYNDPGYFKIDNATVTNVEEIGGVGQRSVRDILQMSLNTGATWIFMQMGGGNINEQARVRWHDYMTNHYRLGKNTNIEQGFEAAGTIPDPKDGFGLNIQFANTSFGQGMTATPLQMGAALASVVNGGTYYRPRLVDRIIAADGTEQVVKPDAVRKDVVRPTVGKTLKSLMEYVVSKNYAIYGMDKLRTNYSIGGKTGTAQIPDGRGGYNKNKYNGMFTGFIGGDKVQYVVVVRVNEPGISGYAGARAAAPVFADTTDMLIDNFNILPKSK